MKYHYTPDRIKWKRPALLSVSENRGNRDSENSCAESSKAEHDVRTVTLQCHSQAERSTRAPKFTD